GPFFFDGLLGEDVRRNVLVKPETQGERIRVEGRVLDGDSTPVPDALVEIWQANAYGRYCHPADARETVPLDPSFIWLGRSGTAEAGTFWFETISPGPAPFEGERMQAPHLCVLVFARGLLNALATRLYFADEPANDTDPVLQRLPAERRETLLAQRKTVEG